MSILLRLPPAGVSLTTEVRCAVVGNVDSGKSSTLGVLTSGVSTVPSHLSLTHGSPGALDDGRGRARVALFRHKHEIETGRTSSVGMEVGCFPLIYPVNTHRLQILGFDTAGVPILPNISAAADPEAIRREKLGWEQISLKAAKIVSFIGTDPCWPNRVAYSRILDLAGHERYLKTTLYGLTSGAPSAVLLIVGANAGLIGMSKEHLAIALALSVPVAVCITKVLGIHGLGPSHRLNSCVD